MKINKTVVYTLILSFFITMVSFAMPRDITHVYATESPVVEEVENEEKEEVRDPSGIGLPTATIDEVSQWTERKGFEIIGFLQKFVQPFAIIIFIGCAIMMLAGALGNGKLFSKGLVGLVISGITYVVVIYAPEIMDIFLNFVRT